jgi:hypothetical protein
MHSRRTITIAIATSAFTFMTLPTGVRAQGAKLGPNGGLIGGTGEHLVELVLSGAEVSVYLLDDGKVVPIGKSQLRMIVQRGGKSMTHALTLAAPNRLQAKLPEPLSKGSIVVITGRDDHGHSMSARFTIA